jgi:beta-galactosidase/beta-glucuronidase
MNSSSPTRLSVRQKFALSLLACGLWLFSPLHAAFERIPLQTGWQLRQLEPRDTLAPEDLAPGVHPEALPIRRMPAMVHDILLDHRRIETPWLPGRAEACRWVSDKDWLYSVEFPCAEPGAIAFLHFRGLDTLVDVYLNGERIASSASAVAPLRVEITGRLRARNSLVLHFHTIFARGDRTKPDPLRTFRDQPVRRAQPNYSAYLGPRPYFSRVGVFDAIELEITRGTEFRDVLAVATLDDALTHGQVTIDATGTAAAAGARVAARLLGPDGSVVAQTQADAFAAAGSFTSRLNLEVPRPQLWWPRGYGDQPLYRAEVTLLTAAGVWQTERRTLGFRRITMPRPLHFVVNGRPVHLRGGNWVTPDWQTSVWNNDRVAELFRLAAIGNYNAFRVWGVVEAPPDDFYERADAAGILLWQDFTMLPLGDTPDAIKRSCTEAEATLKRLKHHPAIFAWCGINEAAMWHHEEYNNTLTDRGPWPGLPAAEAVGELCRKLDPERYYQPSAPYGGQDPNDPREGSTNGYTNMWYVPGYDYLNFATEDTRIAAPTLPSLKKFFAPEDLWPAGYSSVYSTGRKYPYPETWLKYTTGSSWRKTGPIEQFYDATDAASLVHQLGMAEALYYQDIVERQRRGRPADDRDGPRRNGGYLAWKFNDSWPQIYSAKVDYFLEPYHAFYALRHAYAPVLLSFEVGTYIWLWAVNDSPTSVQGEVAITLFHLDQNKTRRTVKRPVTVAPGTSLVVARLDEVGIGSMRREHVLAAQFTSSTGQLLADAHTLLDIERRVSFPAARIDVRTHADGSLVLTTDRFARTVCLTGDAAGEELGWLFEDNYFDLVPGETKVVRVLGRHSAGRITARPWHSPHATAIDWTKPR